RVSRGWSRRAGTGRAGRHPLWACVRPLLPAGIVIAPVVIMPAVMTSCIAGARVPAGRTAAGIEPGRDHGVIVPVTGSAAACHRRLPRPLVDVHHDTIMAGRPPGPPHRPGPAVTRPARCRPAVRGHWP